MAYRHSVEPRKGEREKGKEVIFSASTSQRKNYGGNDLNPRRAKGEKSKGEKKRTSGR